MEALENEREHVQKGLVYRVVESRAEDANVIAEVEPAKASGRSTAIDESLEGARVVWGESFEGQAEIHFVDPDAGKFVLRFVRGGPPPPSALVRVFPRDFLGPLIALWKTDAARTEALKMMREPNDSTQLLAKPPGEAFADLRARQLEAINLPMSPRARLIGPPGTGKTYTIGAIAARLIKRFRNCRVLLVGPTNVAVDTALLAVDDRVQRLAWKDNSGPPAMARVGSRFDPKKFRDRPHLFDQKVHEASMKVAALEVDEPSRKDIKAYAAWKEKIEAARRELNADVAATVARSRLVAVTTSSAFIWHDPLLSQGRWDFVICDEASQVSLPAAFMLGGMGRRVLFAGDPNQLAPVVQSKDKITENILGKTAFDVCPGVQEITLNEQSRMIHRISDVVSEVFYKGELKVCARAARDRAWQRERSPFFVDGRSIPPVSCEGVIDDAQWSQKYNGFIRYHSAQMVAQIVSGFLGSYADAADILVLTPFRAQRALIQAMLRKGSSKAVRVSTVHRSQGTENKIVIFDPVDAAGAFLNSPSGRRLINVAISRAKTHAVLVIGPSDIQNPWISKIRAFHLMWNVGGEYATPFGVAPASTLR